MSRPTKRLNKFVQRERMPLSRITKHIIKNDNIKIPKEIEGERNDLAVYNIGFKEGQKQKVNDVLKLIDDLDSYQSMRCKCQLMNWKM